MDGREASPFHRNNARGAFCSRDGKGGDAEIRAWLGGRRARDGALATDGSNREVQRGIGKVAAERSY